MRVLKNKQRQQQKNLHYLLITKDFEFSDFNSGFQYTDCINYTKNYLFSSLGAQWLLLKESILQQQTLLAQPTDSVHLKKCPFLFSFLVANILASAAGGWTCSQVECTGSPNEVSEASVQPHSIPSILDTSGYTRGSSSLQFVNLGNLSGGSPPLCPTPEPCSPLGPLQVIFPNVNESGTEKQS